MMRKNGKIMKYSHWCGNCQIKIYVFRHGGKVLSWQDCLYTCEYKDAMRNSIKNNSLYTVCGRGEEK